MASAVRSLARATDTVVRRRSQKSRKNSGSTRGIRRASGANSPPALRRLRADLRGQEPVFRALRSVRELDAFLVETFLHAVSLRNARKSRNSTKLNKAAADLITHILGDDL
jgi:hypothetical protein